MNQTNPTGPGAVPKPTVPVVPSAAPPVNPADPTKVNDGKSVNPPHNPPTTTTTNATPPGSSSATNSVANPGTSNPADANANKNANPISIQNQNDSGPTKSTGGVPAISPALNPNAGNIPEPVELNPQTLPALRNLVKHKYRGDAKAMFLKYREGENDRMTLKDVESMLEDSGLPKDLIESEAKNVVKNYDGDEDEKITIDEFDRLYSGN